MSWGFDIKTESEQLSYEGNLDSEMFESTAEEGGNPFIPTDYTKVTTSCSLNLKALSLSSLELQVVRGINFSPAVYYMRDNSGKLELMRLSSASVPISSLSNGGDFSVSLSSISKTGINTK